MSKLERNYISTRDINNKVQASECIIQGLAEDGGLYVPEFLDKIKFNLEELKNLDYPELAYTILKPFLTDFSESELESCIDSAYKSDLFDTPNLIEVTEGNGVYFMELWHGPTAAFKDMALTILPYLLTTSVKLNGLNKDIIILTATSGDTGKAALEGFKDVPNTQIFVYYPKEGVSIAQKRQMITTTGNNTHVISVEGNFDDTQNSVKEIFNDSKIKSLLNENGFRLSSANSINIGRLLPQIVYYFYSYFELVRQNKLNLGDKVNFIVPSGNFGDILAGYYALKTGLPVNKLVCASNKNNILTDFFKTGEYNLNREFYKTTSPSMDILISSNLERLLFEKLGRDSEKVTQLMKDLKTNGSYKINPELFGEFLAEYASEEEVLKTINNVYKESNILIDPHTAVGQAVYNKLANQLDEDPTIILSTANPYKFSNTVYKSIFPNPENLDEFEIQELLSEKTGIDIPEPLKNLKNKDIKHTLNTTKEKMKEVILNELNINYEK